MTSNRKLVIATVNEMIHTGNVRVHEVTMMTRLQDIETVNIRMNSIEAEIAALIPAAKAGDAAAKATGTALKAEYKELITRLEMLAA